VNRNFPIVVRFFALINLAVYLAWNFWPAGRLFMATHFLLSGLHLREGIYWTLLTSVFSQNMFLHLAFNMVALLSFGPPIERLMGHLHFAAFYVVCGVTASIGHVLSSKYFLGAEDQMALGASGAVAGLLLVFSLLFPRSKILVFGIIPVPALYGALAFVAIDVWGLVAQSRGHGLPIGHGAHLGGALAGAIYYFIWGRRLLQTLRSGQYLRDIQS
jgi:membrane associated rhomboid family serine protease